MPQAKPLPKVCKSALLSYRSSKQGPAQWACGLILRRQIPGSNRLVLLGLLTEKLKVRSCADCPQRDHSVWHTEFLFQA